ncbi:hypothetical protein ACIBL8_21470 [Streptomyces sp. NPDC050523]|uniref:hypothetical protein n=1 Tax=Streptomyces sp. NPDC050523 TaxID=3365622 RepID=UPI0037AB092A
MSDAVSTSWPGPAGEAWNALDDQLQSWAESIDWEAYVQAEQQYLNWAYTALAEITAHAGELSDTELAALETDRRAHPNFPGKPNWWSPRYYAHRLVTRDSAQVAAATKTNLAQLNALGIAAHDAGMAVVGQGLLRDPDMAEFLAGPWIRLGHPFPRPAHRPSWNDHPAAPQPHR